MRRAILILNLLLILIMAEAQNKREMRGVWIATVANIDWPQNNNYVPLEQQRQMIEILDSLHDLNFNTIMFQVRPTADAFYKSDIEPWSKFLTGEQGVAPEPFYDPLEFTIKEAHKRQIEVHVWINPYRVLNVDDTTQLSKEHIFFKRPELFVKYGQQYYFNPGLDETREYLNNVIEDIVTRYDIDAVHLDDYFYPYRIYGKEFPDEETYFNNSRGYSDKGEWRRDNVNLIIRELNNTIKSIKSWVEFGISPFGVWRNDDKDINGSATRAGQTNYDDLYADVRLWLEEGWIDYVVPQLYWEIGKDVADYEILVDWWSNNSFDRNLYIGLSPSTLGTDKAEAWKRPNEICRQLEMNKEYPDTKGAVFFSCKGLLRNEQGLCDSLRQNYYKYPALNPTNKNLKGYSSAAPRNLSIEDGFLTWDPVIDTDGYQVAYYVVYMFDETEGIDIRKPQNIIMKTKETTIDLSTIDNRDLYNVIFVVTSVNRYKQESIILEKAEYQF